MRHSRALRANSWDRSFRSSSAREIAIPDQGKIMRSYKRRLLRMQAAQRDIHGGFKINVEAQIAQEQLIHTLQDVVSSSLKVCQLSLVVGLRTSSPIRNSKELEEAERTLADRRQRVLHASRG